MNKHKIISISLIATALMYLSSCNLVFDKDDTEGTSAVSVKPVVEVIGDRVISMKKGGTYNEQGIKVEDAHGNEYENNIVSGEVDPNKPDMYIVTYKAWNQYDWASYAYRGVLVYEGDPYQTDIAGNYKDIKTGIIKTKVYKSKITGYWVIDNAFQEGTEVAPKRQIKLQFAEIPGQAGHFKLVPIEHPVHGIIKDGTAKVLSIAGKPGLKIDYRMIAPGEVDNPDTDDQDKSSLWVIY